MPKGSGQGDEDNRMTWLRGIASVVPDQDKYGREVESVTMVGFPVTPLLEVSVTKQSHSDRFSCELLIGARFQPILLVWVALIARGGSSRSRRRRVRELRG